MPASSLRRHAAALLGYVCVAVAFAWPLPLHLFDSLPGSPSGDLGVYVWNLWVFHHEIVEHHRLPFLTLEILALAQPVPLVLHNYTTFANILAFPLISLIGTVASFNVLVIGSGVLTAYAMFLFARARTGDDAAAWIGGLLFGFSPFMMVRSTVHFSLVLAAPLPIFAWLIHRMRIQPRTGLACAAGVVVAWAFLCDPYYAVYCVMMAGFMLIHPLFVFDRPSPARRLWPAAALDLLIVCVAGLVLGIVLRGGGRVELWGIRVSVNQLYTPVLVLTVLVLLRVGLVLRPRLRLSAAPTLAYLRVASIAGIVCAVMLAPVLYAMGSPFGERQWITPSVPWRSSAPGVDLLAFFVPNPLHPLFGGWGHAWLSSLVNGLADNVASVPWVALLLIAGAVVFARFRPPARWVAFTVFFALLALGPFVRLAGQVTYVPTPWALVRYLPVISAARIPSRMAVLVMLGLAVIVAMAMQHLRARSRRPLLLTAAVIGVLGFELLPAPRYLHSAAVPSVYSIVGQDPRPVRVLTLPFGLRDGLSSRGNFSAAYQFYQIVHEKRLVGGYLSRLPDGGVARYRRNRTLRVLMRLSEGTPVEPDLMDAALASAPDTLEKLQIGYVVIDTARAPAEVAAFAHHAFNLEFVAQDGGWELYRTPVAPPR